MKYIFVLTLAAILTTAAISQTRINATMIVDSVQREFIVVRPGGSVPSGGYPMVFMFHGSSGDGEKFYNISGWKEKGETEKFVTVFPSSLRYCFIDSARQIMTTKWNTGEAQSEKCPGVIMKDDVYFVRKMVDTISALLPINRSRIYASGFSNGGSFVSKLAVEMSDVLAAAAAAAGSLNPADSSKPKRYLPIAFSVGNLDSRITEKIGGKQIPFNDSCLFYLGGVNGRYRGAFNLADTYTRDSNRYAMTYLYQNPADKNLPSTQFSSTLFIGLDHEYPNGKNYPVAMADLLWEFFRRYTLPLTSVETPSTPSKLTVYPNPARDYIVVDGAGEITLTLRNLLGQIVYSTQAMKGATIHVPQLAAGLYIVVAQSPIESSYATVSIQKQF